MHGRRHQSTSSTSSSSFLLLLLGSGDVDDASAPNGKPFIFSGGAFSAANIFHPLQNSTTSINNSYSAAGTQHRQ